MNAAKNTLVPLILRLALGVVFVYHGLGKVTPENDWGASWAVNLFNRQARPPEEVIERIEELKEENKYKLTDAQVAQIQQHIRKKYLEASPKLPETLTFHGVQLAVAWGELVGGFAMLLGLLTRLAALGLLVIQVGAVYLVTAEKGFSFARGGGYEYNLVLLAMCLALVLMGGGALSVDRLLTLRRKAGAREKTLAPAA